MSEDEVTNLAKGIIGEPEWTRRWRVGETGWQRVAPDPYLLENGPTFFGGTKKRIFLPLCGKSMDLLWLYENGLEVVGVELVEQPVKELFDDGNFEHSVEDLQDDGKVYKSNDGRLTIFRANIFQIPVEKYGRFDTIWDNGSFIAINLEDHNKYRDLMYAVMKPDAVYYMKTLEYDGTVWPGPPHSISEAAIKDTFGETCRIELLDEVDMKKLTVDGPKIEKKETPRDVQVKIAKSMTESISLTDTATKTDEQVKTSVHAKENTSSKEQSKTDEKPKPLSAEMAAIKISSFRFDRWFKLQFK